MYYNADTDRARKLDSLAEETRKYIARLNPPKPQAIVWSVSEGRYINNPDYQPT